MGALRAITTQDTLKMGRNTFRLKGFDYSQPGEYFVTICTHVRRPLFGVIKSGLMILSEKGRIAEQSWIDIPNHFPHARIGKFQIMPDHVHGVLEIIETPRNCPTARHVVRNKDRGFQEVFGKPRPGTLGTILRSYKAAVTKLIRREGLHGNTPIWQQNFHDWIIHCDSSRFFIEQYIALNPLVWEIRKTNNKSNRLSPKDIRALLQEEHGLTGHELARILQKIWR